MLLCKDKNFKANHNQTQTIPLTPFDVCYYAKIRILKQITTENRLLDAQYKMFVTMQR